ncbi:alkene reductase [Amaricoccus solimangrovi]|uniref:Alkene reductase n=1 Tax=Amaricoccus solimangrovi TaxID=2589815 RepID=A0A501WFD2_9RHOB|nr:alkene reductase [Amaricoccus solimangrovi]TPE48269.1 alkene reductase [Amaricoccus solimangrovi]
MTEAKLFTPLKAGALSLRNRVVMAPLTRNRARPADDAPGDLAVEYYRQRASAGLIISEGTQISPMGKGYALTPGIHSAAQIDGWSRITEAVHAEGGAIVAQIWHVGRISHTSLLPDGAQPVGPSALTAEARTFDGEKFQPVSAPRALDIGGIGRVLANYHHAAMNARSAGFDGVEIHAANGYLIEQFLRASANERTDAYGGSVENRTRFLEEVVATVSEAIGADRVGVRLSPFSHANGVEIEGAEELYARAIERIDAYGLAYLHMIEGETGGARTYPDPEAIARLRSLFKGVYIANNGYDRRMAIDAVESGAADAVAFGRLFISNPDLVERLRRDAPLNEPDRDTFYGGGAGGYTDYPSLPEAAPV